MVRCPAARDYLNSEGFLETSSPILTPAACEGTTTLFALDYFDKNPTTSVAAMVAWP